ncbi:MAG: class I SAM-dependent methyltransferase [Candidatus Entotheonellia bacterium]
MEVYPLMEEQARKGAQFYDHLMRRYSAEILGMSPEDLRAEYIEQLEVTPGARILDVGAGTGTDLAFLWSKIACAQLFALDISVEMLRQCQRKLRKVKAQAEMFLGFAERLPFKDSTFEVVCHVGSINEFKDQRLAIQEMVRVAKSGTRIVIVDEWLTDENVAQPMGQRMVETLPSLPRSVVPPLDCVPTDMLESRVNPIWRGYGYCLQFRKP